MICLLAVFSELNLKSIYATSPQISQIGPDRRQLNTGNLRQQVGFSPDQQHLFHQHLNLAEQQALRGGRQLINHLQQQHHQNQIQFAAIPLAGSGLEGEPDLDPELRHSRQLDRIFAIAASAAAAAASNSTGARPPKRPSLVRAQPVNPLERLESRPASNSSSNLDRLATANTERQRTRVPSLLSPSASSTTTTTTTTTSTSTESNSSRSSEASESPTPPTGSDDASLGFDIEPVRVTPKTPRSMARQVPPSRQPASAPASHLEMNSEEELRAGPAARENRPASVELGDQTSPRARQASTSPAPISPPEASSERARASIASVAVREPERSPASSLVRSHHTDENELSADPLHKLRSPNIKVVFNNNPHFIIGREHVHSSSNLHESDGPHEPSSMRRGRRPSLLNMDDHHSDESIQSEIKVDHPGSQKHIDDELPCKHSKQARSQHRSSLPPNLDQIDLADAQEKTPFEKQLTQQKSSAPPPKLDQMQQQKLSEQVDTPFDQIVKSGLRPPLRMVVSMRNEDGQMMRVPINLQGSAPKEVVKEAQHETQLKVSRENTAQGLSLDQTKDSDTPVGGDFFDPGLIRPFPRAVKAADKQKQQAEAFRKTTTPTLDPSVQLKSPIDREKVAPIPAQQTTSVHESRNEADCDHKQHHTDGDLVAQQKQVKLEQSKSGFVDQDETPLVMSPINSNGLVQLMMPQLTQFRNKTLADMLGQFQKALGEQMQQHLAQQAAEAQQHQDDQEDLMVALMAANITKDEHSQIKLPSGHEERSMSMTVIKPPRGTSLQEAIKFHSSQPSSRGQTVAILHSGPQTVADEGAIEALPTPVGVTLRAAARPNPDPVETGIQDPDGFSARASDQSHRQLTKRRHGHLRGAKERRRRSLDLIRRRHMDEPDADRLAGRSAAKSRFNYYFSHDDPMIGAASELNSLTDDESDADSDEDDGENEASDSNEAPSSYGSGGASDSGNDSDDMSEDTDESSVEDEPYNQGASSERDYNSPSFEIPQIDINPATLEQKGCRTVLREVQEIPMDGLGVVQADGRPGSGYSTSTGGLRVRREIAPGAGRNSINSRKVTSIVMTKECHFPNDGSDSRKSNKTEPRASQIVVTPTRSSIAASAPKPALSKVQPEPQAKSVSLNFMPVNVPKQFNPRPLIALSQVPILESSKKGAPFQRVVESGLNKSQQPWTLRLIGPNQIAPQQTYKTLIQPTSSTVAPQVLQLPNQIKRRSVQGPIAPQVDVYIGADSRRNEVVAQKLYKPPSKDDPFHTLSYSSKNGNDPDMEQDEDDQSIMDADEGPEEGEVARSSAVRHRKHGNRLSEGERRALLDPNFDDTDPPKRRARPDFDSDFASDETRVGQTGKRWPTNGKMEEQKFGRKFKLEHSVERPKPTGLVGQLSKLQPGSKQGFVTLSGGDQVQQKQKEQQQQHQGRKAIVDRRRPPSVKRETLPAMAARRSAPAEDADEADEPLDEEEPEEQAESGQSRAEADDPDADPDYNPKESRVPASTKPKRMEKSFAYVHRDLPRKGTKNPDDFAVSYGRGNFQTEQEDYDSDRDNNNHQRGEPKERHQKEASQPTPVGVATTKRRQLARAGSAR